MGRIESMQGIGITHINRIDAFQAQPQRNKYYYGCVGGVRGVGFLTLCGLLTGVRFGFRDRWDDSSVGWRHGLPEFLETELPSLCHNDLRKSLHHDRVHCLHTAPLGTSTLVRRHQSGRGRAGRETEPTSAQGRKFPGRTILRSVGGREEAKSQREWDVTGLGSCRVCCGRRCQFQVTFRVESERFAKRLWMENGQNGEG